MEEIDDLGGLSKSKSFASMSKKDSDTLMVVDALNLSFRYKHSGQRDFAQDYLKLVQSLAQSYKAGQVIIVCDKGSSSYRKNIYPEYKGDRKAKQELQTPEEKLAFEEFFKDFEQALLVVADYYPVLRYDGVEADDIAAYIVKNKQPHIKVWLISSDKDYDLLISDTVSRFSYVTRKEVTIDNWPYGCSIENYIGYKCLEGGDDNIKGVAGIGEKRAIQLPDQYDDIFTIIDLLPLPGKQKFIQNLNSSADLLELNLKLMDLLTYCEEAIGSINIADINSRLCSMDILV